MNRPLLKALVLVAALAAGLAAVHGLSLREHLTRLEELARAGGPGTLWVPLLFTAAVAALVAVGCPRLPLCAVGGMAFGFGWGLLWTQLGTIAGSFAIYSLTRWAGREGILRRWPRAHRLAQVAVPPGVAPVILARQLPIAGIAVNVMLGLSGARRRDFLLGTAVGILPQAIPMTLVGTGVAQESLAVAAALGALAVAVLAAAWLLLGPVARRGGWTAALLEHPPEDPSPKTQAP